MSRFSVVLLVVVVSVAQALVIQSSDSDIPAWVRFQNSVAPLSPVDSQKAPFLSQLGYTLSKFTHSNCGSANDVVKINSLTVSRDLHVTLSITATADVVAPIQVELEISKKVLFWIKVPCLSGKIGSCVYSDICAKLAANQNCPPQMSAIGIPCQCPFTAATYTVQNFDLDLGFLGEGWSPSIPSSLIAGDFKLQAKVKHNGAQLACLKATFTLHH